MIIKLVSRLALIAFVFVTFFMAATVAFDALDHICGFYDRANAIEQENLQ